MRIWLTLLLAWLCLGGASWSTASWAQPRAASCTALEAQLLSLRRPKRSLSSQKGRLKRGIKKQARIIKKTEADAKRAGCTGFMLFPSAACRQFNAALADMRRNLQTMERQLNGGGNNNRDLDRRRGRLLQQLARNNCGPQYARFRDGVERRDGAFARIFGGRRADRETYVSREAAPKINVFRTVCVRKCDGFFWPVSFSTLPSRFGADAAVCQASCPGVDVSLYTYRNPTGQIDDAVTPGGEPYRQLDNAFRFRSEFVDNCKCKRVNIDAGATSPSSDRLNAGFNSDANAQTTRIVATLFANDTRTEPAIIPLPTPRPQPFDIGLFENPAHDGGRPTNAEGDADAPAAKRAVRVVGPAFVYARSAAAADEAPAPTETP